MAQDRWFVLPLVQSLPETTKRPGLLFGRKVLSPQWTNCQQSLLEKSPLTQLGFGKPRFFQKQTLDFIELTKNVDLRSKHADFTHKWRLTAMNNNVDLAKKRGDEANNQLGAEKRIWVTVSRVIYYNFSWQLDGLLLLTIALYGKEWYSKWERLMSRITEKTIATWPCLQNFHILKPHPNDPWT